MTQVEYRFHFGQHSRVICVNTTKPTEFIPRGQRCYLLEPSQSVEKDTVRVMARTIMRRLIDIEIPWSIVENARLERVPPHIGQICAQHALPELQKFVDRILAEKMADRADWSVHL